MFSARNYSVVFDLTSKVFCRNKSNINRSKIYRFDRKSYLYDEMSVEPKRHVDRKIRRSEHDKPASQICLQVIGNGQIGSARSLFVFNNQYRCLFNCGEGTQRIANEHKIRLSKLDHVFVTHSRWDNIGGLPGLILTVHNIGVRKITIHGPPNIGALFDVTKSFIVAENIDIMKRDAADGPYGDHIMSVNYVQLLETKTGNGRRLDEQEEPFVKRQRPNNDEGNISVAYICRATDKPGQLQLDKCVELGVPPGPLLGQLKSGKDVTLPCGKIVKSADVVSDVEVGPVFIVLECPTVDYLDSLLDTDEFVAHQDGTTNANDIATVVVHFTPVEVMKHDKYKQWMNRFHSSTDHLIINESNFGTSSSGIHRIQHKLNLLHPKIFPLLNDGIESSNVDFNDCNGVVQCPTLLKYHLRPLKRIDLSSLITLSPDEYRNECTTIPEFSEVLLELKSKLKNLEKDVDGRKYPEVVFLGTGSSIPSKARNTSGILVNVSDDISILMDCGEATFNQMYRFYGKDDIDAVLRRISVIFVSHLHADHHIGLIQLLKARRSAFANHIPSEFVPVILMAPVVIKPYLNSYDELLEPILDDFTLLNNCVFFPHVVDEASSPDCERVLLALDMKKITTCFVKHCVHAFGIALTHKTGWKLVYSGDTMPCESLIRIGKQCDLLIHEATMEDDLKKEAVLKRHSCTSEAIEVGHKMNAKFVLLTHFSQRYAKVPIYNENFKSNVGIAFDNMRVSFDELYLLPHFTDALKIMFSDDIEDMQMRTEKKIRQRIMITQELQKLADSASSSK